MSTMVIERAVVLQVLEALEYAQQDRECPSTTRQAITAIRAALAQQQAEPVAWMHPHKPDQVRLSPQDGWLPLVIAPPKAAEAGK